MKKLTMALLAGCMTVAVAGAYAATGSPADSDKAGRQGPGTAAGAAGAVDPTPGKAGPSSAPSTKSGSSMSSGTSTGGSSAASTGTGASSTAGSSGASATTGGSTDDTKGSRRARRASKG